MKRHLLSALAALTILACGITGAFAQSASFTFNDFVGTPNATATHPGASFTFSIFLNFVPGGSVANLEGLSYWLQQTPGSGTFSITNRDFTGSLFNQPQTAGITYPQSLAPSNASDLGATLATGVTPLGAGTYFVARITILVSSTAALGDYSIMNTVLGGKTSVVSDDQGHTFAISQAVYQVNVPETGSTLLLIGMSCVGLLAFANRRIAFARA
jgi:hypothetical protein